MGWEEGVLGGRLVRMKVGINVGINVTLVSDDDEYVIL